MLQRRARAVVCALLLSIPFAASVVLPTERATAQQRAPIRIALDCYATPEIVRITNTRNRPVYLSTIGSLYRPRDNEPFAVNRRLGTGAVAVFRFGTGAGADAPTRQFIFQNDVPGRDEGVIVATSAGTFLFRCSGRLTLPNTGVGAGRFAE